MRKQYDLILYGASGFTGKQTVEYCRQFAPEGLRWAIAGRSRAKLEAVNRPGVDVLVADADDEAALDRLAAAASVVASTAGPFSIYGGKLVEACVRNRTHYCDITGETPWIRGLIAKHHAQAAAEGTRIIPCCGFDSIPSDYGAWLVSRELPGCTRVAAYFRMKGGLNGGTLATALHLSKTGEIAVTRDPFLLDSEAHDEAERRRNADPVGAHFDEDLKAWVTPFFMGPINTRIVRRTQALLSSRYDYQEYMRFDGALMARAVSAGSGVFEKVMASKFWRWIAEPLLPAPGEGPSEKVMDGGFFECEFIGQAANGARVRGIFKGVGDPGNRITVKCLCESAFVLAAQTDRKPGSGGVLTPVKGLGEALVPRLRSAGICFDLLGN
jgi:short subunit dehydrogenase-like uncharacterized protein